MATRIVVKRGGGEMAPDEPEPEDIYEDEEEYDEEDEEEGGLQLSKGGGASKAWAEKEGGSGVSGRLAQAGPSGKQIRTTRAVKKGVTYRKSRSGPAKVRSGSASESTKAKNRNTQTSSGKGPMMLGVVVLVILLIGAAYVAMKLMRGPTAGYMGAVEGNVTVTYRKTVNPAELNMRVKSGSTITVSGENSKAYFLSTDGGRMQIVPGTTVTVGLTKQNFIHYAGRWAKLKEGEIYCEVPVQPPEFPMKLRTEYSVGVMKSGTLMLAATNKMVYMHVLEGSVKLTRNEDKSVKEVPKNHYVYVSRVHAFEPRDFTGNTQIQRLAIVEAGTGVPMDKFNPLRSGILLDMQEIPSHIAISAETAPAVVGSVRFELHGIEKIIAIENTAPYTFRGRPDAPIGDAWEPMNGEYVLKAWSFSLKDGKGKRSAPKIIKMTVIGAQ